MVVLSFLVCFINKYYIWVFLMGFIWVFLIYFLNRFLSSWVLSESESESEVAQSCPTLCDPMDCSPPGSSVHGILQARILEWVARPFARGSFWPRGSIHVSYISCIGKRVYYHEWHLGSPRKFLEEEIKAQTGSLTFYFFTSFLLIFVGV